MFAGFSAASKRIPKLAVYAVGLIPAIELLYLGVNDQLGAEPVRALEHGLGLWAMRFLLATLALSPLRQLAGVDLLRFRRQFGLLAFYYVVLHLAAYVAIDMGLDAKALWTDIISGPMSRLECSAFF